MTMLRAARCALASLAALMAGGCSPADVLNALTLRRGFDVSRSIAYGDGPRRTLDLYRPDGAARAPVIVYFYGGSWQGGEKETYLFMAASLARRGYLTVVPDYRVYPEVRYPGFVEDAAHAVRWVKDNAERFGGDPRKIVVMGHSAGAYIAAMLAIDGRWLEAVGLSPSHDIAGLVGLSGPYDFLPLKDNTLKTIFGGDNVTATQPVSYVSGGVPPALLATGESDATVDPGNASRLAARLKSAGNDATVKVYSGVNHLSIVGAFAPPLRFLAPVVGDVDSFVSRVVAARTAGVPVEAAP